MGGVRKGDWIQTFTGVEFYPFDPKMEEIRIEDIAHALSMQCRYSGHVSQFYSVAEHSIRVAELCSIDWKLWGLLHDASEAYLVDLPRPVKRYSQIGTLYSQAEDFLMIRICERFGLTWQDPAPPEVARADKGLLWVESRDLMPPNACWDKWRNLTTGAERPITRTLTPKDAESLFLAKFHSLTIGAAA